MRLLRMVALAGLVALLWAPVASAVTIEASLGVGYSPQTYQDASQMESSVSYGMKFAGWVGPHVVADVAASFFDANLVAQPDNKSRLYTGQLEARYFSKPLYSKDALGVSTPLYTMINPFVIAGAGLADGEILGEDINTFLSYGTGLGVRYDPTSGSQNVVFDLSAKVVTGTGSLGQATTVLGVFLDGVLQLQFLGL